MDQSTIGMEKEASCETHAGEMRRDLLTNHWIVYAPQWAERPHEMAKTASVAAALAEEDSLCPFCAGNEGMIPPVAFELKDEQGKAWRTRVVPNKYPVLRPDTAGDDGSTSPLVSANSSAFDHAGRIRDWLGNGDQLFPAKTRCRTTEAAIILALVCEIGLGQNCMMLRYRNAAS